MPLGQKKGFLCSLDFLDFFFFCFRLEIPYHLDSNVMPLEVFICS